MSRASKKKKKKQVCVPKSIPWDGSVLGRGVPHQPGFHPKSWGEFGPGDLDFMVSDVFSNINNSIMLLLVIKREPRVEKSRIKSRRCLSRQGDKSPFYTYNSCSYLGLLQSSKQLQIDRITVAFTSSFSLSSLQK